MIFIASIFASVIPMVSYLLMIWLMDKYEREPLGLVVLNFLLGAIVATSLSIIVSAFFSEGASLIFNNSEASNLFDAVIIAPFVEESIKGLILLRMVFNKKFDNLTDGLVYGGATGLGFGMTENFLYFIYYGDSVLSWIFLVIIRSGFSAVMHCIATATLGAFLGLAKFSDGGKKVFYSIIGFILAIFFHFIWNLTVSFDFTFLLGIVFMLIMIGGFISIFLLSVKHEQKVIYNELLDEANYLNIPIEHIQILSAPKRNQKGWFKEEIRKEYIKTATKLAFRKMQIKSSSEKDRNYYLNEINILRQTINYLLNHQ